MTSKVVTFYSPRGELERGMTLANVAWMLAEKGRSVLAVDWELNSPSLHQYFERYIDQEKVAARPGVAELIRDLRDLPNGPRRPYGPKLQNAVVPVERLFPGTGKIDLLLATERESSSGGPIDWAGFHADPAGLRLVAGLRTEMAKRYDFILVNSQSGSADGPRAGLVVSPDMVVVCLTQVDRSIASAARAMQEFAPQIAIDRVMSKHPPVLVPVVFRVDPADLQGLQRARRAMGEAFQSVLKLPDEAVQNYRPVEIPHFESSFDGLLAGSERSSNRDQLKLAYGQLAAVIAADSGADELEPTADVLISFASADRLWAEWATSILRAGGLRVRWHQPEQEAGQERLDKALGTVDQVLVLVSPSYLELPATDKVISSAAEKLGTVFAAIRITRSEMPEVPTVLELPSEKNAAKAALRNAFPVSDEAQEETMPQQEWLPRFPNRVPSVSNLDVQPEEFTGRVSVLNDLRDLLTAARRDAAPVILSGRAGMGKTSLALEYARRFGPDYDVVWWVPAESNALAKAGFFDLANKLEIVEGEEHSIDRLLARFQSEKSNERWLLILDSADVPSDIEGLVKRGHGHVLVTSANANAEELAHAVQAGILAIGAFKRSETAELLKRRMPSIAEAEVQLLAEYFEDFPLAVNQASRFLQASEMSVDQYLESLAAVDIAVTNPARTPNEARVTAAWQVALDVVHKKMPVAARAFKVLTFLAPEPIPQDIGFGRSFITKLMEGDPGPQLKSIAIQVRHYFTSFGLANVQYNGSTVRILRLVQEVMRHQQEEGEAAENRRIAFEILAEADPDDPDDPNNWPAYKMLWPHLESPGMLAAPAETTRKLIVNLIRYRYKIGDYLGSEELAERVLQGWEEASVANDLYSLIAQCHLANALRRMGRFNEARMQDEDAVIGLKNPRDSEDLYMLIAKSGLASDFRALDEYEKALELDEATVRQATKDFGPEEPRTLMFASNLAMSYRMVGDAANAAKLNRKTFEQRMLVLGADHPFTWFSANSYGRDLRDLGDFAESKTWLERALQNYRRVYKSADHPDTLWVAKNLAVTLRRLGLFPEAHKLITETQDMAFAKLGPEHPESLICQLTVATTYSGLEEHGLAQLAARKTVNQMAERLKNGAGDEHVYTMLARNNLAAIELRSEPAVVNLAEMKDVEAKLRNRLRSDHWILSIVALNLANHYAQTGDHVSATLLTERAYSDLTRRFSPRHPDAVCAGINLAIYKSESGDSAGAEKLMAEMKVLAEESARQNPGLPNLRLEAVNHWRRWTYNFIDPPPLT